MIFGLKYYRHFLLGFKFVLRTDHAALTHMMRTPNPVVQSVRYLDTLAEYHFAVQYRPGDSHRNVDVLSRCPRRRDRNAPLCRQCGPMLDPVAEDPDAEEAAKMGDHGGEPEAVGLHLGLDSVQTGSDLKPSLAKVTIQIPDLDSGASATKAKTEEELEPMDAELYACRSRRTASADLTAESAQPRVDFHVPLASPDLERDKSAGLIDVEVGIVSASELIEQQKQDTELGVIRAWLECSETAPDKNAVHAYGPEIQQLWAQRQSLKITRGVLYRRYERQDGSLLYLQVLVPQSLHTAFLDAVCAGAISGHPGIEHTGERLQEIAYWKGWTSDVQAYVQRCPICTAHKPGARRKQGQMQQALAFDVMQKVHVDLICPFPTSKRGYKYFLTAICGFTKYLVCVPIRDKVSATVANALMKHLYLVYGLPKILVHDQGSEFWSDVMMRLAALLDIQSSKITSHRPNSNGVVERVHAMLHSMFGKLVNDMASWTKDNSRLFCYSSNDAV